jgi:hypothetical protein
MVDPKSSASGKAQVDIFLARNGDPKSRALGVFELQGRHASSYRVGCEFIITAVGETRVICNFKVFLFPVYNFGGLGNHLVDKPLDLQDASGFASISACGTTPSLVV